MMVRILGVVIVFLALVTPGCCIFPKMISETAFHDKPFGNGRISFDNSETIASSTFFTFGHCQHNASFQMPISGGSGLGVILPLSNQLSITNLTLVEPTEPTGSVTLEDVVEPSDVTDQEKTFPFRFQNIGDNGATLQLNCDQLDPVEIMVLLRDDSDLVVHARVQFDEFGGQRVEFDSSNNKNAKSEVKMKGMSKGKSKKEKATFQKASKKGITIQHETPDGVAVVQMQVRNAKTGKVVHRSIVTKTRKPPDAIQPMGLLKAEVDTDGDVVIKFRHVGTSSKRPLKVDARIGIEMDHSNMRQQCVDVSAIVEDHTLVVNNGWIRQCLNASGLANQADGWDVVVLNATVADPEDGYRVLAYLEDVEATGIRNHPTAKRQKLARPPLSTKITKDMRQGRKPRELKRRILRAQQMPQPAIHQPIPRAPSQAPQRKPQMSSLPHRKVLVHGYCSLGDPFPASQFTNYVEFSDPTDPASWSHDTFARKIANFTRNLGGCGCIAHSQGGQACLHLKTYYHSCLDTPIVKGKAIQSVGTPYQGTPMAGTLASVSQMLGYYCGYNSDLTYSGSQSWLSQIPSWARSQVYYYTTSFSRLYCSFGSQLMLSSPNDGVTEMSSGQLSGGNNMGHTQGWCHATSMRYPPQATDASRNAIMNAAAQY